MIRILGAALLVLGLYGLVGMPHEIGFFWGGIAGVAMGSMLIAFSFSAAPADRILKIEPKILRNFDAFDGPEGKPAAPTSRAAPSTAAPVPLRPVPVDLRQALGIPVQLAESRPDPTAAVTPLPNQRAGRNPMAYGWFGPDRTIQMASGLGEITAAIRSGTLKPQTSVHCMDAAGKTGPVIAANTDPLLRALFWAIEAEIPEAALPGLVKSLTEAGSLADLPARKAVAS